MLEAELTRDLNLPSTQEIRSRADQALIQVLRQNPQDGLNALKEKAATCLLYTSKKRMPWGCR